MDEDEIVTAITVVLLLAHIGAFAWAWRTKQIRGVLGLNLLISAVVTLYWLFRIAGFLGSAVFFQAFIVFEAAVLATCLLAVFKVPVPRVVIWTEFAAHLLLTCAALFFMLTFSMDRMM